MLVWASASCSEHHAHIEFVKHVLGSLSYPVFWGAGAVSAPDFPSGKIAICWIAFGCFGPSKIEFTSAVAWISWLKDVISNLFEFIPSLHSLMDEYVFLFVSCCDNGRLSFSLTSGYVNLFLEPMSTYLRSNSASSLSLPRHPSLCLQQQQHHRVAEPVMVLMASNISSGAIQPLVLWTSEAWRLVYRGRVCFISGASQPLVGCGEGRRRDYRFISGASQPLVKEWKRQRWTHVTVLLKRLIHILNCIPFFCRSLYYIDMELLSDVISSFGRFRFHFKCQL